MADNYWNKQDYNEPLYPDIIWSRPTNKLTSGKLLIIGGNSNGFKDPAKAYTQASQAGIGSTKILMPDALQKIVGKSIEDAEFAPSNKSGSFSKQALSDFMQLAKWSDGVLIAGDISSNSETSALLEDFAEKYNGILSLANDMADQAINNPYIILNRPQTLITINFAKLQLLLTNSRFTRAVKSTQSINNNCEVLHEFTKRYKPIILTEFNGNVVVANDGNIITTKLDQLSDILDYSTKATVWWLQNPTKPLEAVASSIVN
jgi:NAD(P)H-hydrate repair Nnr-like enzyme with NAD(P)H-hydrate dehydratase domain